MSEQQNPEEGLTAIFQRVPVDYSILAGVAVVMAILPLFLSQFVLSLAIITIYWAYLGNAWNIMGGYAGQFSFGHAAFYGIGAYTSSVLLVDHNISPWIGMLVGAVLAAFAGLVMGFLFFQFGLKGHFFALGTFAIAEMFRLVSSELEVVNTSVGLHIPLVGGDDWVKIQFEETLAFYYYVIVGLFVVGTLVTILVVRSKLGYYFLAIREDEDAAAALGVNRMVYKIMAVSISAALTAIGGSFFIQYFLFVDPSLAFGVAISIEILLRPIVGGVGTIWGPLAGALLLTPLEELTRRFVRNPPGLLDFIQGSAGVDVMIFGILIIVVVLFIPDGLVGGLQRAWTRMRTS